MARVTTVITSINSDTSEAVTIDAAYTGTDGTITLSASVPAAVKVGDVINDSAGNDYLITGISGSDLTCQDFDSTTDPATGAATIGESYATVTLWAADLDAGTNAEAYKSGDDAVGECYGLLDESPTINGGGTIGLNSITLTVPESERHDGTAGNGARIVRTSGSTNVLDYAVAIVGTLEWLEIDGGEQATSRLVDLNNSSSTIAFTASKLILHSITKEGTTTGFFHDQAELDVFNCIVYDILTSGGTTGIARGFSLRGDTFHTAESYNNTVHNVVSNSDTGSAAAYRLTADSASSSVKNCIGTDTGGTASGSIEDFAFPGTNPNSENNLSSDDTADDGGGSGHLLSKTSLNQFVSNSAPYDLHLKSGADAFEAGTDLGTTPAGVNIDIDGFDRNAGPTTWSMGAHDGDNLRGVGAILIHPGMTGGMQELTGGLGA